MSIKQHGASGDARLSLPETVCAGIEAKEFRVAFQPVVHAFTGRLSGVECLIRWQHPDYGLLLPGSFLDAFHDQRVARETSYLVLESACQQLADWQRAGGVAPSRIMINVQPMQLVDDSLSEQIMTITKSYDVDPSLFELELVETDDVSKVLVRHEFTRSLRRLGVRIALDDFGTGYTSLTVLDRLEVDTVKLARDFLPGIPGSPLACTVLEAILDLFSRLGIGSVVEGVETAEQMAWLARRQDVYVQGYYIGRPQSTLAEALTQGWRSHEKAHAGR